MKFLVIFTTLLTFIFAQAPLNKDAKFVTTHFSVEGKVLDELRIDMQNIQKLPVFTSGKKPLICMSGAQKAEAMSYTGVLLKDVLNLAKIKIDHKKEMNQMYIIAQASDGYKALFSYHEIYNTPIGDNVVIYYKKDGALLGTDEGAFALISLDDAKNGGRHVYWLDKIIVKSDR